MESKVFSQNLLLDANDDLKFSDFVGSSIDGEDAHVCASAPGQFRPPWSHCPSVKDVMFAMGSVFYEVATSRSLILAKRITW